MNPVQPSDSLALATAVRSTPAHSPKEAVAVDAIATTTKLPPAAVQAAEEPPPEEEKASMEELSDAINKLNERIQTIQRDLQFSLDEDSGYTVVKVMTRTSNEVIRQFPSDVILRLAQTLDTDPLNLIQDTV